MEWIGLGAAVVSVATRAGGHTSIADAVDTASGPLASLAPKRTKSLEKRMARRLREEVDAYIGGRPVDEEMTAAVQAATVTVAGLADRDPQALTTALRRPEDFAVYVRTHGGYRQRELIAEHARPLYDYVLAAASRQLIGLATTQMPRSTAEILYQLNLVSEQLGSIDATVTRAAEAAERAAENSERLLKLQAPKPAAEVSADDLHEASNAARESARPLYLPPIDRRVELGLAEGEDLVTPVAILGEGGAGKSVLAGDLVDWAAGRCLLVPCSRVPANADLGNVAALDIALGNAAADGRHGLPLTELLDLLPADVLLVIDTLDLLLTADTADDLEHLLRTLSDRYELVVTSRDQEWRDLMGPDVLPQHRLGLLSGQQVLAWVDAYLAHRGNPSSPASSGFRRSVASTLSRGGRVVLGSPVRLAMACSLYATAGSIPEDLSVPQLYRDYWIQNVVQDRRGRRLTPDAEAQEATAMEVARRLWQGSSTIFIEYVPRLGLGAAALQDLLSSGLLRPHGTALVGFFHQTFAEFAVATHLAALASAADLEALGQALGTNSPAHWGVARYLAWSDMDPNRVVELADVVPRNDEGIRIVLRLLSTHSTTDALTDELQQLEATDGHGLRKAFGALSDAQATCCPAILDSAQRLLSQTGAPAQSGVVRTLGPLLTKLPPDRRNEGLQQTCSKLIADGGKVALTDLGRLLEATIITRGDLFDIPALLPLYRRLGQAGQRMVIHALADTAPHVQADLLEVAVTADCPGDVVNLLVDISEQVWTDGKARTQLGWETWQDIVLHHYPARWSGVQVRLVSRLCKDPEVWLELLQELLDPETPLDREHLVNVASFVAARDPELVATTLCTNPPTPSRPIAGTLSTVISYLGDNLSKKAIVGLLSLCRSHMQLDPRRVLTAMVQLAVREPAELDTLVAEVVADATGGNGWIPPSAVDSFWDSLFAAVDQASYQRHHDELTLLVSGGRTEDRRRRAKMVGREAFENSDTWERLRTIAFDKSLVGFADLAIKQTLRFWDRSTASAQPLVQLISSPHGSCARLVADDLAKDLPTDWTESDLALVVDRLIGAIENTSEDPQIAGALITLLVKLTHQTHTAPLVTPETVRQVLSAYRTAVHNRLADGDIARTSALLDQWLGTLSRIGVFTLDPGEIGSDLAHLLVDIDISQLGGRAAKGLTGSIIGITGNLPRLWHSLTQTWPDQPVANQVVVAEALIRGRLSSGHEIALERAREDSCPTAVRQRIHQLLDT